MRAGSESDGGGLAPDAVARMLDAIYDAVADAGRWRDVATLLPRDFGGNYGIVLLFDTVRGEVRFDHFCTPEGPIPPEWLRRYEEASLDPAARPMLVDMLAEAGRVQTFAEWSARSVASGRLPRWMEEARTFGIAHNAFFYLTDHATGSVALFAVTRLPDRSPYAPAELARFGELIPHVRRAFRIARRLADREAAPAAAIGPLDDLAVGIVLVDADGHGLHADPEARAVLDATANPLATPAPSGEALRLPGLDHALRPLAGDGAAAPLVLALRAGTAARRS